LSQPRTRASRLLLVAGLVLVGASVVALPLTIGAGGGVAGPKPLTEVPPDRPDLGIYFGGISPAKVGSPCVGMYVFDGRGDDVCTHGPFTATGAARYGSTPRGTTAIRSWSRSPPRCSPSPTTETG
jgi:hypothetical protein